MTSFRTVATSLAGLLKESLRDWNDHKVLRLSAALAYYSTFSIAPLLLVCLAVAGWAFGPDAAKGHVEEQLRDVLGAPVAASVQSLVKDASRPSSSITAAFLGMLTLLAGAAGVFAQLKDALNTIWDIRVKPGGGLKKWLRGRLLSFAMVLIIGALLLASVVMSTTLSGLAETLPLGDRFAHIAATVAATLASFGIITVLFAAIFKLLPDTAVRWRDVWSGAVFTALLFEAGKFGLGFYLGRESTASAFGAAASLVLVLLWVYYASLILFFGAVFTKVRARRAVDLPPAALPLRPPEKTASLSLPRPVQAKTAGPSSLAIAGAATGFVLGLLLWRRRL